MMERTSVTSEFMDRPSGPTLLSWNLTRQCNLRCAHCYLDAASTSVDGELSEEEALSVVDQVAGLSPGAMVVFSGGEPLLRRDLAGLVDRAAKGGLVPVLGTNGTLLDETKLGELLARGLAGIGVSLDSPDPRFHDGFRGKDGAWRDAMKAIEACRGREVPFQIQTSLTRENLPYLRDMVSLSAQMGAMAFNLFFLVCTGRGESLADITPQQYEQALAILGDLQQGFSKMKIRARCAPHFVRIVAEQRLPGADTPAGCMAGNTYLRLSPEGKVTPCPYLPIAVGDLRQDALAKIWRSSPLLKELRSGVWGGRCGVCSFSASCRGCRARAYAVSGDYLGEDPWCSHQTAGCSSAYPARGLLWRDDACQRMERVPGFVRERVIAYVEAFARDRGYSEVTVEVLDEAKSRSPIPRSLLARRH